MYARLGSCLTLDPRLTQLGHDWVTNASETSVLGRPSKQA
jgi:hypothetical protein